MASFKEPNSEVYFLTVPFSSDYKNIIDFSSATAQYNAFMGITGKKHFTKLNIIRPTDNVLYIKEDFGEYYKYNYIMFRNPLLSSKWFYAFITDSFYNAENVTEIHYMLDVWQTFQFDITYYRCMIERGIVPRNKDNFKDWLQAEPLNVTPYNVSDNLNNNAINTSWEPRYILETVSFPAEITGFYEEENQAYADMGNVIDGASSKFGYGGADLKTTVPNSNCSAIWGLKLEPLVKSGNVPENGWYERYTNTLKLYGGITDHRTDILNIRILPEWLYNKLRFITPFDLNVNLRLPQFIKTNATIDQYGLVSATINQNKLTATDYTPRNKKMLSSLARSFVLYNRSRLINKQFLPEFIIDNNYHTFDINCYGKPIGMTHLLFSTFDYRIKTERYFEMPFNLIFSAAYNSNVGVQKAIRVINAGMDLAQGVAHIAESAYGLQGANLAVDFARIRRQPRNLRSAQWELYKQKDLAFEKARREEHGLYMLNSIQDTFNAGVSLAQALSDQTGSTSTQPDMLTYSSENLQLHFEEVNPNLEDCKVIDTFLDMYGYSINETDLISNWTNTRSNWNYVKTQGANLKVKASDSIENTIKTIFNNGTTIWHSFSAFGKYNNKNVTDGTTINL